MQIAIAVAGILSIYLGYRLCCGIPLGITRGIAGVLLALFGMTILSADVQTLRNQDTATRKQTHQRSVRIPDPRHKKATSDWVA